MRWLPQSLASRVTLLYGVTLLVFLLGGLAIFLRFHSLSRIEDVQQEARVLGELAGQVITESAVIGDFDTVKRTLEKAVGETPFRSAAFIDPSGAVVAAHAAPAPGAQAEAPQWLTREIGSRLYDLNTVLRVGGRDYGVMRLVFDEGRVAAQIWALVLQSFALAGLALAAGLILISALLRRWLGGLDRLGAFERKVAAGQVDAQMPSVEHAPAEIRDVLQVVNRTTASLRDQFGQRIHKLKEQAEVTLHAVADGVITADVAGMVLYANPAAAGVFGIPAARLVGQPLGELMKLEAAPLPAAGWRARRGEVRRPAGDIRIVESTLSAIHDQGAVAGHVLAVRDVTERKAAEDTIHRLAFYDPLTELPNRRQFAGRAEELARACARTGRRFALLYIDLDRFKNVNDGLGHEVGDRLLVEAGRRIQRTLRDGDFVGRLGGDEFAALVAEVEEPLAVSRVAERLIQALEEGFEIGEHRLFVSASIGIALYGEGAPDVATLLKQADAAMYRAKEQGKRTFAYFSEELETKTRYRLEIERDLRLALAEKQLFLEYQPKVDATTQEVIGAEALLRWHHPVRGRMAPDAFVPIAEESRLIIPIGLWVVDEACRQLAEWARQGLGHLKVAINLSAVQFQAAGLANDICAIVARHGVQPGSLEVEITESLLMNDPQQAEQVLNALRATGITIAIDDFGTGYSSLSYLKRFPVGVLKIDRSFVRDLHRSVDDRAIAAAILSMARSLGLRVVAEGVETEEQRDILVRMDCDFQQGYFFSRPLAAPALVEYVRLSAHRAQPPGLALVSTG